jgi:hypothetical protein
MGDPKTQMNSLPGSPGSRIDLNRRRHAGDHANTRRDSETRSVAGIRRTVDPEGFDFLDVGDAGPEVAKLAKAGALPF